PTLAALALVLGMVIALALPVALVAQSLIVYSSGIIESVRTFVANPANFQLPAFIRNLPMVGPWLVDYWNLLLQSREELVALAKQVAEPMKNGFVAMGGAVGEGLVQILIALFVAFFFYRDGDRVRR